MKKLFLISFLIIIGQQTYGQIDTLVIRDTINPPPYVIGGKVQASQEYWNIVSKPIRDSLIASGAESMTFSRKMYDYPKNKPYYLKFFINDTIPLLEGVYYESFNYGFYKEYNKNGSISILGNYNENYVIKKNGKVKSYPQRDGVWEFYNLKGKLKKKVEYENGK